MAEMRKFIHTRLFAISLLFVAITCIIFQICDKTHIVLCTSQMGSSLHYVMESDAYQAAARFEAFEATTALSESNRYIQLSAPTTVQAAIIVDDKILPLQEVNGTTVGEALYSAGITYDGNDLLTPAAEKPIENGDEIILKRVEYEEYNIDTSIPYETIYKNSSLLQKGKTKVVQKGMDGLVSQTFNRCTVDGVEDEVQLLGEKTTRYVVDEIILLGSGSAVSPVDFGFEVDSTGKPLHYKKLLTNQIATGYSARPGALTASGRQATVGTVAVHPDIIPYGSKLYITSTDGKFVYGCAIAADTGTGLLDGIIDVDLFYETYQESAMNGRKIVDIYVLE